MLNLFTKEPNVIWTKVDGDVYSSNLIALDFDANIGSNIDWYICVSIHLCCPGGRHVNFFIWFYSCHTSRKFSLGSKLKMSRCFSCNDDLSMKCWSLRNLTVASLNLVPSTGCCVPSHIGGNFGVVTFSSCYGYQVYLLHIFVVSVYIFIPVVAFAHLVMVFYLLNATKCSHSMVQ